MARAPFQDVVERHGGDVWRFCASQVGSARADDCFQETMLAALRAYPQLRDIGSVRAWLLRIAARKAVDLHRRDGREELVEAPAETAAPLREPPDESLFAVVRGLPDRQRRAVAYRLVADLSYHEIASLMDTSEEAARRSVHEALKVLRLRLAEHPTLTGAD